jgi:small subunit ribosomal protein S20
MGHSLSASKRERQNVKRRKRNRANVGVLRQELKRVRAELETGPADGQQALSAAFKALDRAARKNAIPKKRADRKKARMALVLKRALAAKSAPAAQPQALTAQPQAPTA